MNRLTAALLCGVMLSTCGCQAGVMIGRILFGDPEIRPPFELQTGVRLDEQEQEVRVVCTSPSQLSGDFGAINVDLPEQLLRRLKKKNVPVGNVEQALSRLDDLGGQFDARVVAAEYDDGYLMHINIDRFTLQEPGSNLYRGRADGTLTAYQIVERDGESVPTEIFVRKFKSVYPNGHPVPSESVPEQQFRRKFVAHVSGEINRQLTRYRNSEAF